MKAKPPVTWLISVKNALPYLTETLESIAAQTYTNQSVLVWDDCSTDGTSAIGEVYFHRMPGSGERYRINTVRSSKRKAD